MKYSKATNYALHTMLYFMMAPAGKTIGVQPLAELQEISPTYLSKILTKLVKAGMIESTPGVNGGYTLLVPKEDVSFLRVIQAIEGNASLLHCDLGHVSAGCLIQETMAAAEQSMEQYLQEKKLVDLLQNFDQEHPQEHVARIMAAFH
ncbi:RrF2 family transcriptional regulator [Dictyobacter arantiisoli]|uniref:Rrf2 family transcriptional regulator n=1 Tax=Dictyobacter arantiisoli TaxID=2014874 RepID=A0A5A5TKA1_9CHLR|nr:Rrf2 family transcriptional regulator [Dictyobacter arantiisoli]GCF11658.1 Rrf2 family transcriptional regulator [Dictyobacter arantiisoli]